MARGTLMFSFLKKKQEVINVGEPGEGQLETHSSTWLFIKAWAEDELSKAREENDYMKHDELKTAALRGRIKLLKETLALPKKKRDNE